MSPEGVALWDSGAGCRVTGRLAQGRDGGVLLLRATFSSYPSWQLHVSLSSDCQESPHVLIHFKPSFALEHVFTGGLFLATQRAVAKTAVSSLFTGRNQIQGLTWVKVTPRGLAGIRVHIPLAPRCVGSHGPP